MIDRLTHQREWTDDIDLSQEFGYKYIFQRLAEYENAEEQGLLVWKEQQTTGRSRLCDYDKTSNSDGLSIWYEKESNEVVCMVSEKEERGKVWICSVFVSPKYRHLGLCESLLNYADENFSHMMEGGND
ncbi:MAG: GNAT family N-acetyltransferase [Oscillospiraceae bacterium]